MSVVRLGKNYQLCATCDFWHGPREPREDCFVFDNRDSGTCSGPSFKDWKMGATSTCLHWTPFVEPVKKGVPTHAESKF